MKELAVGDRAPEFTLPSEDGSEISLADFKGKNVVLYFYPKDLTPGCTTEACDFRDNVERLQGEDTQVLGVSKDSVKMHTKFIEKHQLNFPLLADEEGKVCDMYGVWKEKSMYGRKYMGIERSTFLIDKEGILQGVWRKVSVTGHVKTVLEAVKTLK
ncbi:MAG: thioredoxin-dependent thiol peroxidase [Candidatus Gracilibacteria bacterium]